MLEQTGVPTLEQVKSIFPSIERINSGPVAIVECYQEIPCNPCYKSCRFGAISDLTQINTVPEVYSEKCTGCSICVYNCPGLAIMIVDGSISCEHILFKIPYEFVPLPKPEQIVRGLDRSGKYIADVEVVKVQNNKAMDRTPIVHVLVDRKYLYDFKNIGFGDAV